MKTNTLTTALLFGATILATSAAQAGHVVCADGTIYDLSGDEITDTVACASHGGLSPTQIPGANEVQTSVPIPPIEDTRRPTPHEVAQRVLSEGGAYSGDRQTSTPGRRY